MTPDKLTPESIDIMRRLFHNPQPIEDSPSLQRLFEDKIVMGSLEKVHLTALGTRLLADLWIEKLDKNQTDES